MLSNYFSKRNLAISTILITTLFIQGCGKKVDCNDGKNKENAIAIIQSHLNNALWYQEINAALSGNPALIKIKTIANNDELKQCQCSATYSYVYNSKPREIEVNYELAYLQDKAEIEVRVFVDDVVAGVMKTVMFEKPIKNGIEKIFDKKTGNLQKTIEWKNGQVDGVIEIYNPSNNKLISQIHMSQGVKDGKEKGWDENGEQLLIDLDWKDKKANGFQKEFEKGTGRILTDLVFRDGKATGVQTITDSMSAIETQYKDGLIDGTRKTFYIEPTGSYLREIVTFKAGKRDGIHQVFDKTGKVEFERYYQDDVEVTAPIKP